MQSPITAYLNELHADIATLRDGVPYPVRPKRARIDPDDFGIALATVDGYVYTVGTTAKEFALQSISKPLTYGLALSDVGDRKSTRLNSSHVAISYAVFCLKKKTKRELR